MYYLYRHAAVVVITTILALFMGIYWGATFPLEGQLRKEVILDIAINTSIACAVVWLIISILLSKCSKLIIWIAVGSLSPAVIVPILYHIPELGTDATTHNYGFGPRWRVGLAMVQSSWITFLLVGTILGIVAYTASLLPKLLMQNKAAHTNPLPRPESKF